MISRRTAFWGGLFLVAMTFILTWGLATGAYFGGAGARGALRRLERTPGFTNLVAGLNAIYTQYRTPPDMAAVNEAALAGAVGGLNDPYSTYLTPQQYQAMQGSSSGQYTGIGIEVATDPSSGAPVVTRVFAGSPAATTAYQGAAPGTHPGLLVGDRLVAVDGTSVAGTDPDVVRARIVGQTGTTVQIAVRRQAVAGPGNTTLTFVLTRRPITIQTVQASELPGGVGYLEIEMFNQQTPAEMGAAVAELQADHVRSVVIDLRNNPGGVLESAVGVARYLLPKGVVTYLVPRTGPRQAFSVTAPQPLGVPYAVLVNAYTASAAELLAGAIQDDGTGVIVGEKTFGKGVVQGLFALSGGAAVKLTVASYATPKGRNLDGVGITPDIVVPFAGPQTGMGDPAHDPQLAAAITALRAKAA